LSGNGTTSSEDKLTAGQVHGYRRLDTKTLISYLLTKGIDCVGVMTGLFQQ